MNQLLRKDRHFVVCQHWSYGSWFQGFSAATCDRWQHNPWRLLRQVPHDVLCRSGTESARNNNVLLVKIGLGRELVNPIYHHGNLYCSRVNLQPFFHQSTNQWEFGTSMGTKDLQWRILTANHELWRIWKPSIGASDQFFARCCLNISKLNYIYIYIYILCIIPTCRQWNLL